MARPGTPAPDRAALSTKARDHLHGRKTDFSSMDYAGLGLDILVGLVITLLFAVLCALMAYGLRRPSALTPEILKGPQMYELLTWLVFIVSSLMGAHGLLQYWQRRIWVQTSGTKASVWTGLLSIQLFVGALMPLACLLMLNNAFQVMRWSFG
jgi:hypothetical protein